MDITAKDQMAGPIEKQLFRKTRMVETLNLLTKGKGIPEESKSALNEILALLSLDIDITLILDHIENRIEANLEKLDKGDTVLSVGFESGIEFKLLRVAAMKISAAETPNSSSQLISTLETSCNKLVEDTSFGNWAEATPVDKPKSQSNIRKLS